MRVKSAARGSRRVNEEAAVRAELPESAPSMLTANGGWDRAAERGRVLLATD